MLLTVLWSVLKTTTWYDTIYSFEELSILYYLYTVPFDDFPYSRASLNSYELRKYQMQVYHSTVMHQFIQILDLKQYVVQACSTANIIDVDWHELLKPKTFQTLFSRDFEVMLLGQLVLKCLGCQGKTFAEFL